MNPGIALPLAEGGLVAAIAALLCLGAREFRFFDVAAGVWVISGFWLGVFVIDPDFELELVDQPELQPVLQTGLCLLILGMGLVQALAPVVLRESLARPPSRFAFVSLSAAAIGVSAMRAALGEQRPPEHFDGDVGDAALVLLALAAGAVLVVRWIQSSAMWSRLVIRRRLEARDPWSAWRLGAIIGVQVLLLLVLGFASGNVHKGELRLGGYLALAPLLVVMVTAAVPVRAALLGFAVGFSNAIVSAVLAVDTIEVWPFFVLALLLVVGVRAAPRKFVLDAPRAALHRAGIPRAHAWLASAIKRSPEWLKHKGHLEDLPRVLSQPAVVFGIVVVGCLAIGVLFWQLREHEAFRAVFPEAVLRKTLLIYVLATVTWLSARFLSAWSFALPAFAVLVLELWPGGSGPLLFAFAIVALAAVAAWACYLWILRSLRSEHQLVLDLALLIALLGLVTTTPGKVQNVISLQYPTFLAIAGSAIVGLLALGPLFGGPARMRALAMGLANPRMGLRSGLPVAPLTLAYAAFLALAAGTVTGAYLLPPGSTAAAPPRLYGFELFSVVVTTALFGLLRRDVGRIGLLILIAGTVWLREFGVLERLVGLPCDPNELTLVDALIGLVLLLRVAGRARLPRNRSEQLERA